MFMTNLFSFKIHEKLEFFFVLLCLFIFIFLWDYKHFFDLRLSIIFPAILIIYKIFKNELNLRVVYFSLFVVSACLLHLLISYVNLSQGLMTQYSFNVKPILALFVISLVVSQYYNLLVKNLSKIINLFILVFLIDIFFSTLLNIERVNNDDLLKFSNLFFNCNNGLVSYSGAILKENSHLAMMSVPIILSSIVNKNLFKKNLISYIFLIFFIFNYITYSTTFHLGIVLSSIFVSFFLICKKEYKKLFFIFLIMGISILFLINDKTCNLKIVDTKKVFYEKVLNFTKLKNTFASEDETIKLDIINSTKKRINLTSDVHRNAIFIAKHSIIETNLIGLGLDNYVIGNKYFRYRKDNQLSDWAAYRLNERDASSNLIKIFAEFGIFAIFPIVIFLYFVFRSKEDLHTSVFLISIILTQLIRGAGYFNGGFALFSLMICYSVFANQKFNND